MKDRILDSLRSVEREQDIRVLCAVESGSRAWGFASPDSDWDVRFIYVHPTDWYLSIEPDRDVIERPISDGLDLSGWDLRKALVLFRKGNPPLVEWLRSPIVYLEQSGFAQRLRAETREHFRMPACLHHYLSMARKNYREYLRTGPVRLKKYLYVLRPLLACAWVRRTGESPPMEFGPLLDGAQPAAEVRACIDDLLERKKAAGELGRGPRVPEINEYIEQEMASTESYLATLPKSRPPPRDRLDRLFRQTLAEVWGS